MDQADCSRVVVGLGGLQSDQSNLSDYSRTKFYSRATVGLGESMASNALPSDRLGLGNYGLGRTTGGRTSRTTLQSDETVAITGIYMIYSRTPIIA